jgi:hypothetical protein
MKKPGSSMSYTNDEKGALGSIPIISPDTLQSTHFGVIQTQFV